MKHFTLKHFRIGAILTVSLSLIYFSYEPIQNHLNELNRQDYEAYINSHEFNKRLDFDY